MSAVMSLGDSNVNGTVLSSAISKSSLERETAGSRGDECESYAVDTLSSRHVSSCDVTRAVGM